MIAVIDNIAQIITAMNKKIGFLLSFLIIPIFFILMLEVFFRYFFNSPTVWGNESTQLMFGTYSILAGGYILSLKGHVTVDILYSVVSRKTKAWFDIITFPVFLLFIGMLFYFGCSFAYEAIVEMERTQSAWNPPVYPFKTAVPLGALLLILQSLTKLWNDIKIVAGLGGIDLYPMTAGDHH